MHSGGLSSAHGGSSGVSSGSSSGTSSSWSVPITMTALKASTEPSKSGFKRRRPGQDGHLPPVPRICSALDMARRERESPERFRLKTGCAGLDKALSGGILRHGITEICGEAGCGKTQFVLRLLASAVLSSKDGVLGRSVYICTEGRAPTTRLASIVNEYASGSILCSHEEESTALGGLASKLGRDGAVKEVLDRVLIKEVHDFARLAQTIEKGIPELLRNSLVTAKGKQSQIKLVVIDSLAAILRLNTGMITLADRSKWFLRISYILRDLSDRYNCCFIIVNQVSAGSKDVHAALGLTWANCINSRFMLSRENGSRHFSVVFSPAIPETRVTYQIKSCGLCAC